MQNKCSLANIGFGTAKDEPKLYFLISYLLCGRNAFEVNRKRNWKVDGCSRERAQYSVKKYVKAR